MALHGLSTESLHALWGCKLTSYKETPLCSKCVPLQALWKGLFAMLPTIQKQVSTQTHEIHVQVITSRMLLCRWSFSVVSSAGLSSAYSGLPRIHASSSVMRSRMKPMYPPATAGRGASLICMGSGLDGNRSRYLQRHHTFILAILDFSSSVLCRLQQRSAQRSKASSLCTAAHGPRLHQPAAKYVLLCKSALLVKLTYCSQTSLCAIC